MISRHSKGRKRGEGGVDRVELGMPGGLFRGRGEGGKKLGEWENWSTGEDRVQLCLGFNQIQVRFSMNGMWPTWLLFDWRNVVGLLGLLGAGPGGGRGNEFFCPEAPSVFTILDLSYPATIKMGVQYERDMDQLKR